MTSSDNEPGGRPSAPPLTDELRRRARNHPNGYVYQIDPAFDPAGRVPPEGVAGAWRVDGTGEIVGDFVPNARYRPTPAGRGLPAPTDPLDDLTQRVATGWANEATLVDTFLGAEVVLPANPAGGGDGFFSVRTGPSSQALAVFSAPSHAHLAGHTSLRAVSGRSVARQLPDGYDVVLNPASPVSVVLPHADVRAAAS